MSSGRILFFGVILVTTALYFLNPGPEKFEDFLRKEGGAFFGDKAEEVSGGGVTAWLAERVGREVAGQASRAFERENYHVASLYHVDVNGRAPGGEWEFLGIANVFIPITTPEI